MDVSGQELCFPKTLFQRSSRLHYHQPHLYLVVWLQCQLASHELGGGGSALMNPKP